MTTTQPKAFASHPFTEPCHNCNAIVEQWKTEQADKSAPTSSNVCISQLLSDISTLVHLADDVGMSRQSSRYASNGGAVTKLVDLEMQVIEHITTLAAALLQAKRPLVDVQKSRAAFEAWWEDFKSIHPEWEYADSNALRFQAWQAALSLPVAEVPSLSPPNIEVVRMTESRSVELPELLFPATPNSMHRHPKLGEMFDRMQLHAYALKYAEGMVQLIMAAQAQPRKPDFFYSEQHGELLLSYEDVEDFAYKWKPLYGAEPMIRPQLAQEVDSAVVGALPPLAYPPIPSSEEMYAQYEGDFSMDKCRRDEIAELRRRLADMELAVLPPKQAFPFEEACSGLRYASAESCGEVGAIWLGNTRYPMAPPLTKG
ncbi:MAG: hypothetical protein Q7U16_14840 [Agitococcus sp.]|nr:hypothetical protein [Agitococcus sp.]